MLTTPMRTMSQGKPTACTMAPPVDGPVRKKSKSPVFLRLDHMAGDPEDVPGSDSSRSLRGSAPQLHFQLVFSGKGRLGHQVLGAPLSFSLPAPHQHTYSKAHAKSHIGNGVDIPVHGGVAQVHQVSHDGHHRGIHHACGQSKWDTSVSNIPGPPSAWVPSVPL